MCNPSPVSARESGCTRKHQDNAPSPCVLNFAGMFVFLLRHFSRFFPLYSDVFSLLPSIHMSAVPHTRVGEVEGVFLDACVCGKIKFVSASFPFLFSETWWLATDPCCFFLLLIIWNAVWHSSAPAESSAYTFLTYVPLGNMGSRRFLSAVCSRTVWGRGNSRCRIFAVVFHPASVSSLKKKLVRVYLWLAGVIVYNAVLLPRGGGDGVAFLSRPGGVCCTTPARVRCK